MREVARWSVRVWLIGVAALGCGGQATPTTSAGSSVGDASVAQTASCPATFAQMNGAPCTAGLVCTVDFACRATPEQVRCTCENARLRCYDSVGLIPQGAPPRCINSNDPPVDPCPPTIFLTEGASCSEVGRSCFYDGEVCSDGITKLDYCQCEPDGTGALSFQCKHVPCSPPLEADQ